MRYQWPKISYILTKYQHKIYQNVLTLLPAFVWHVLNYIHTRRLISTNKKTFYMQKEQNIALQGLYERKARTKSINREKTPQIFF